MKKYYLFFLLLIPYAIESQQIYLEMGKTSTRFNYKDSAGRTFDNLLPTTDIYMRGGYRDVLNNSNSLFFSVGAIYSGYGAIGSDRVLDNFYEWDVTYLGIEIGIDYRLFRLRDFAFYAKGALVAEFLAQGVQTINNQVFNLVGEEEFNSYNFFMRGGLFMTYPISRTTSITANYNYGFTTQLNSGNSNDNESLNFNVHQFGIGLIINLPNCNCTF